MSSALPLFARAPACLRLWPAIAIGLLMCGPALAQSGDARFQSAYAEWRKLSQSEVNCVDRSLRAQGSNLWSMIQRGVRPFDRAAVSVRELCGMQARPAQATQTGSQALASAAELAAEKARAEKAAADKAAAEKAAADTAAKAAADKAAADKAVADKATAAKAAAEKAAADKKAAERTAMDLDWAKADAERTPATPVKTPAVAEREPKETEAARSNPELAYSAADLRMSFISGLIGGPALLGAGGLFFFMRRKRKAEAAQADAVSSEPASDRGDFDRLVTAVLDELVRRDSEARKLPLPERKPRAEEAALH